ncbi:hypothetical protein SSP24_24080 [Streptomyces spinoverrucosus]|uniref:Uncharacterized protein n=1 Tax=Streptomyces spinoverrucosus TaxID=284043 RepID=A0A4Y3VE77_9ACTN|nr:hypothetical protein SSP24_24080 [Streptomyces spinoverrucosus]GHB59438.1 hypothetical protein GCM10010397_31920 [Streptomyces spinoverrucosus]
MHLLLSCGEFVVLFVHGGARVVRGREACHVRRIRPMPGQDRYGRSGRYGEVGPGDDIRPRADLRGDGCDAVIRTQGEVGQRACFGPAGPPGGPMGG